MKRILLSLLSITAVLNFYRCGAPLPDEGEEVSDKLYSVEEALEIVSVENDVARTLYTKAIVGAGQLQGGSAKTGPQQWQRDVIEQQLMVEVDDTQRH